jgi:Subtilase family/MAM domain, meprin/A5/mu/Secretion system C-terminal sorting domain/PKD domain
MKKSLYLLMALFSFQFLTNLSFAQTSNPKYTIKINSGWFVPNENIELFNEKNTPIKKELVNDRYYRWLQFKEIPTQHERELMEQMGISFLDYLPNYTYIVSIPAQFDLSDLKPFLPRSLIHPDDLIKTDQKLNELPFPEHAMKSKGRIALSVSLYRDVELSQILPVLTKKGYDIKYQNSFSNDLTIWTSPANFKNLANMPFVQFLDIVTPEGEPENYTGRTSHRVNTIQNEYMGGRKYDGTGMKVQLQDDGIVGPHIDFTGRIPKQFTNDPTGSHGDHTGGTVISAGNLDPKGRGMAPGAEMYVYNYGQWNDSIVSHYAKYGLRVTSTSYSNGCNAGYTAVTRDHDMEVRTLTALTHVFSAGNSNGSNCGYGAGTQWGNVTGGHKVGKNVITVANLSENDIINGSSSRGPAHDGRIKPDISGKGTSVYSTQPDNTYASLTGTSMSCPGVAGTITSLYQAYKDNNGGNDPNSGLIKAIVLNTADDIGNKGPDFKHGWGRINALRAVRLIENKQYMTDTLDQGNNKVFNVTVPSGVAEVRIMMYYHDYEAVAGASVALINNLDMNVMDPSFNLHMPWILDHTPDPAKLNLPATTGIDTLNNMEQVSIENPAAGTYTVTVNGTKVPLGPQNFFIVYEFVMEGVELTYPLGGEGFMPTEKEKIRWDAFGNSGTFKLEYSTDGGNNWQSIANTVGANRRYFDWTVPSTVTGLALVRITRGAFSDQSDTNFAIIAVPPNLRIDTACCNHFILSWDAVAGAVGYEVSMLGNKYMDSVGRTTNISFKISNIDPNKNYWVSVRSLSPDNGKSRRAIAIEKQPGSWNCIQPNNVGISKIVNPASGAVPGCKNQSEYDITVEITNYSNASISNIPVKYSVNNGNIVAETFTGSIAAGKTANYTFSQKANIGTSGSHIVSSWSEYSGDTEACNDTSSAKIIILTSPIYTIPYQENFESFSNCGTQTNCELEVCNLIKGWYNEENLLFDDIDFRVDNAGTPSNGTGPGMDHNPGTTFGKYLYTEASGDCNFKLASMISPCFDLMGTTKPTLEFWYHMYGQDMGELHVDILTKNGWIDNAKVIVGNQGDIWKKGVIDLTPYINDTVNLRFRAITGSWYQSDIAVDDINIYDDIALSAGIQAPLEACKNQFITINNKSTGANATYDWNFGAAALPGTSLSLGPHSVKYLSTGMKTITLITTDGVTTDTAYANIDVLDVPVADYQYSVTQQTVDFTNNSTYGSSYLWDFGDGNTSTSTNPSNTYTAGGSYTVLLTVTGLCGTDTISQVVKVAPVGINDPVEDGVLIHVFPNPSNGQFTLNLEGNLQNVSWELMDAQGRVVKFKSGITIHNKYTEQIDLQNVSNGLYLLKVNYNDSERLIKIEIY